jgi:hypothetical protein
MLSPPLFTVCVPTCALTDSLLPLSRVSPQGEEGYVRLQRGGTQNPTLNYCGVAADCSTSRP